jgi:ArsR family transcriptional regulator, nickel/cobalt-responsive transcriptional repressor
MSRPRPSDATCASSMQVLADQTRMAVVRLLMDKARHVYELNQTLRLDPTLLSHHLRILRDAGLVVATRDGKARLYRLSSRVFAKPGGRTLDLGCCTMTFN